jgi:hypothetical protein
MAIAALATGFVTVQYAVVPVIELIRGGLPWLEALAIGVLVFGLLAVFVLLALAAIRPRSVIVSMAAALTVGVLLIWGMSTTPRSSPRILLHLAAILSLVALLTQVIQAVIDRRWPMLWILAFLGLGFPIGFLTGGLIGLHIVTQYCQLPLLGPGLSSLLCSG